jgi:hypothetical protein
MQAHDSTYIELGQILTSVGGLDREEVGNFG